MNPPLLRLATCVLVASLLTACSSDKGALFTEVPPPQAAANWEDVRDASAPGPACIQASPDSGELQNEDCPYLNIAAPVAEVFEARPVMVWFHGGGDETGSGHEGIYKLVGLANATEYC